MKKKSIVGSVYIQTKTDLMVVLESLEPTSQLYSILLLYRCGTYKIPAIFYINKFNGVNHQGATRGIQELELEYKEKIDNALPIKVFANPDMYPEYFL